MKRILNLIIIFIFVIFSTACSTNVDLSNIDQDQLKIFNYQESNSIMNNINISNYNIDIPTNGSINSYCIYNNIVYYSIDFFNKYNNPTGGKNIVNFESEDNTQIRSYNLNDNTDILIYQYNEQRCIQVTDIQCNGTELVWEDYPNNNTNLWNVKKISLNSNNIPENIISYNIAEGEMVTITLTITTDNLYWYEQNTEMENALYLCKYNFKTGNKSIEKEGLTISSPYEHVNILNNIYTTYEATNDNTTIIHISNLNNNKSIDINVAGTISNPVSNGEYCIWMKSYDSNDRGSLFIYDILNQTYEKINTPYIFSYGMINNIIIVNQENGLYCYDIKNKIGKNIVPTDNISFGYTVQGQENNVYVQKIDTEFNLLNLTYQNN